MTYTCLLLSVSLPTQNCILLEGNLSVVFTVEFPAPAEHSQCSTNIYHINLFHELCNPLEELSSRNLQGTSWEERQRVIPTNYKLQPSRTLQFTKQRGVLGWVWAFTSQSLAFLLGRWKYLWGRLWQLDKGMCLNCPTWGPVRSWCSMPEDKHHCLLFEFLNFLWTLLSMTTI